MVDPVVDDTTEEEKDTVDPNSSLDGENSRDNDPDKDTIDLLAAENQNL